MSAPVFSIVMPTYNSAHTIAASLDSLQAQDYAPDQLECLVIDGGSTDETLQIAEQYPFVRILQNEKRLPEYAKQIGFREARGRYLVEMDSDEALARKDALRLREEAFKHFPPARLLIADRLVFCRGAKTGVAADYINACGDPFSYFIYRPKLTILKTFEKNVSERFGERICLLRFEEAEKRPIADGGTTTVDLAYWRESCPEAYAEIANVCAVSDKIMDATGLCLCVENDDVLHNSRGTFRTYLKKLRFRVVNNLFTPKESGFSSRRISSGFRKYLFPFYTIALIPPLIDAFRLAVRYRDATMLLHPFYCYYTCFFIAWYGFLKLLGVQKQNKEY